jgi:hypothetical protein
MARVFHFSREGAVGIVEESTVSCRGVWWCVAVAQTAVNIAAPGEDVALSEHATVHLLPAYTVMLDHGLVRHTKGSLGSMAPVCGVQAYRVLVESFGGAAEGEEALRVEIGENEDENVEREIS